MFEKYMVLILCIPGKNGRYAQIYVTHTDSGLTKRKKYIYSTKDLNSFLKENRELFTLEEIYCIKEYAKEADLPNN